MDDQTKNTIIRMQSKIIDELYLQLMQYVTIEELESSEIINQINEVAKLRAE